MSDLVILILVKSSILVLLLMTAAAYMTWAERVLMARMQMRLGPNRVGFLGLLQPMADAIKLLTKERFQPAGVAKFTYWLAPGISLFTALIVFVVIPIGGTAVIAGRVINFQIADVNAGILFILAFSSLAVYGVVLAGWSSNSRYSLIGGLRGTAQMISYEIPMGLSILTVILSTGSLRLSDIVDAQQNYWFILTHPISFIIYVITAFAETNRSPFDMPESEQELTGGYHTEYGGMKFALFFVAEYVNMIAVSSVAVTLFLGGWHGPYDIPVLWFVVKLFFFLFLFIWVRSTMARFRYGQLMSIGWKVLTPIAIANLIMTAFITLVLR